MMSCPRYAGAIYTGAPPGRAGVQIAPVVATTLGEPEEGYRVSGRTAAYGAIRSTCDPDNT